MKKHLFLGMVTLLVAIPGFSQIKADDQNANFFKPGTVNQLPYTNYQGFQLQSDLYQPKVFKGVLIPKAQYEKPNWVKPEDLRNNMPRFRSQASNKIRVARPDSSNRYH